MIKFILLSILLVTISYSNDYQEDSNNSSCCKMLVLDNKIKNLNDNIEDTQKNYDRLLEYQQKNIEQIKNNHQIELDNLKANHQNELDFFFKIFGAIVSVIVGIATVIGFLLNYFGKKAILEAVKKEIKLNHALVTADQIRDLFTYNPEFVNMIQALIDNSQRNDDEEVQDRFE